MLRIQPLALASLTLTACATTNGKHPETTHQSDAALGVTHAGLAELLTRDWEERMEQFPMWATRLGDHRYDDKINDSSQEALAASRKSARELLKAAKGIAESKNEMASMAPADVTTLSLFIEQLENGLALDACKFEQWTLSARGNPITEWNELAALHPVTNEKDADNLLARYAQVAGAIDENRKNLALGAKEGLYANAESTRRVLEMFDKQLAKDTKEWPMIVTFAKKKMPEHQAKLTAMMESEVRPALVRFQEFLKKEILPNARTEEATGLGALPIGQACYAATIAYHTTLPLTANEIHGTGLAEIARINEEMRTLGEKLFGTKELPEILKRLRTDPKLYFETEEQVEEKAKQALESARKKMNDYFGIVPKAECIVTRIPEYEAPFTTVAYYRQPVPDGSEPGRYYINTYEPKTRPRYEAEALAFHEAIPGHHLQIAIAQELQEMPAFRKHAGFTAYVEGWALYTETLSDEMGLYTASLDRMGKLSYEAWRASRLVVDTGLHAMGWSRSKAKQFMMDHTALAANNIDNEVDRYIVWPGQALAYKTGQIQISSLRKEAEAALGDRFDIKAFHDVILGSGAVSIPVLKSNVQSWIASQTK